LNTTHTHTRTSNASTKVRIFGWRSVRNLVVVDFNAAAACVPIGAVNNVTLSRGSTYNKRRENDNNKCQQTFRFVFVNVVPFRVVHTISPVNSNGNDALASRVNNDENIRCCTTFKYQKTKSSFL
jgi:hypothetical protein